ncbi:hypothetical protein [Vibrio parahaemolyticus]|uniref:hypothetical protein n=1 Tax=Vibrio parahaemolyticus TaxID=670 RepID=UPI00226B58D4|nr:hypothetical protein [Vibrio parahaemolyticus]MCX8941272.1 hypothetical protein [Vibrio parahaemolyticus]
MNYDNYQDVGMGRAKSSNGVYDKYNRKIEMTPASERRSQLKQISVKKRELQLSKIREENILRAMANDTPEHKHARISKENDIKALDAAMRSLQDAENRIYQEMGNADRGDEMLRL